jgi:predicted SAM-dependent methyltransferase
VRPEIPIEKKNKFIKNDEVWTFLNKTMSYIIWPVENTLPKMFTTVLKNEKIRIMIYNELLDRDQGDEISKLILRNPILSLKLLKYLPKELNIVLGASGIVQPGWIPTEIDFLDITKESDWKELFLNSSIDRILAEHVWEHLAEEEGIVAAKNCYKYLKSGGRIRIAVPDGLHPSSEYIEYVKPGGVGAGAEDHKVLYTFKSLQQLFKAAGFKVQLLEYWDENRKFHHNKWDLNDGLVLRSKDFDERNKIKELSYTSIILDGIKNE